MIKNKCITCKFGIASKCHFNPPVAVQETFHAGFDGYGDKIFETQTISIRPPVNADDFCGRFKPGALHHDTPD